MEKVDHFIGGKRTIADGQRCSPVFDPATGLQTSNVIHATRAEVERAIASGVTAAQSWGTTPPQQRASVMFSIRDAISDNAKQLAKLITSENGKTLVDANAEVARALESVEFSCGIPQQFNGAYAADASRGVDVYSMREPLGVVACVTPFNFPVMVPLWMLANALACGNAVVLKPSEKAPSATLRLAEVLFEAGLPEGVLNVLQGGREVVDQLLEHPDIEAVSFVGSTPVARSIYERAAAHGKRVQALGGAKNHLVVMPDADIDQAADAAISAGFGAAGERCMAASVIVAVGGVGDGLIDTIRSKSAGLVVGSGCDEGSQMGPLITQEHRDRVASYLDAGQASGARLAVDGRTHNAYQTPGFFLGPSIIDEVSIDMSCYRDEIFGPVLSVVRVETLDDAIALINASDFSNGTAIFTNDGGAGRRFQNRVKIGMVGINVPIPVPVGWFSFGGWKGSLFGDTHMYGPDGVHFFSRQKVVTARWHATVGVS